MQNPGVVFTAPGEVAIEERGELAAGPGEVVIRNHLSLISTGTELTLLEGGQPADSTWAQITRYPETPGYCCAGKVCAIGEGVDASWMGRRVTSQAWASHARFVKAPLPLLRPVDKPIPDEAAVFSTLAEIVLNGVRHARPLLGECAVVYGLGLLGQLAVRFCRLAGMRPVFGVDVSPLRLGLLPDDPAVIGLDPRQTDVAAAVTERTGRLADVVFEVSGVAEVIPSEFAALRPEGRFIVLSSPRGKTQFDFHDLCNRHSFTIIGVHNSSHPPAETPATPWTCGRDAEYFFQLAGAGEIAPQELVTHHEPWQRAPELYAQLVADRAQALGVILDWQE